MIIREHLRLARARLLAAGIPDAEATLDVELLARDVLGWDRAGFVARTNEEPPDAFGAPYLSAIERRVRREPMAYIRGRQEFWGREFLVSPAVLIPRPETELIIEEALASPAAPQRILDIGTGSGCLAITLALDLPGHPSVVAADLSENALAIARRNAVRLIGDDFEQRLTFHRGSLFEGVHGRFDLIVSNPPYVTDAAYEGLEPEVRQYEPRMALVAGADGLGEIREILRLAAAFLTRDGRVLMEMGFDQAEAVRSLVADTEGLSLLRIRDDLQGIPRVVVVAPTGSG